MDIIHIKFKKAIVSLLHKRAKVFDGQCRDIAVVTDDESTQVHKMLEKIILRSYGSISRSAPSIIYKSLPRVMQILCSKRKDIRNIRSYLEQVSDL